MRWNVSPPLYEGSRRIIKKFIWWPSVFRFGQDGEPVCVWMQYAWIEQRFNPDRFGVSSGWENMHWESFEGVGE